ncbi:hypothetical protein ACFWFK_21200, partial [Micromonospora chalcea]
ANLFEQRRWCDTWLADGCRSGARVDLCWLPGPTASVSSIAAVNMLGVAVLLRHGCAVQVEGG